MKKITKILVAVCLIALLSMLFFACKGKEESKEGKVPVYQGMSVRSKGASSNATPMYAAPLYAARAGFRSTDECARRQWGKPGRSRFPYRT